MDPERLGRFEVGELLGQGGMGSVYAARDTESGERVALKVLSASVAEDEEKFRRFEQEVKALARVEHPNIVRLLGPIERDGPRIYFAMELLEGETLSAKLRREGAMPVPAALAIVRPLLDALRTAHRDGVVHRDIKPSNILLVNGEPRITDFGLARMEDISRLTRTGQLMGTLDYMSPEQCEGTAIDQRTDLYSVGILLYEMLAGAPPFRQASPGAVLKGHLTETPSRIDEIRADLPSGLCDVVSRLLEKEPDARFETASDVLEALEQVRDPSVTVTFHPGTGPDMPKLVKPRAPRGPKRGLLAIGAALLMAAAAVSILLFSGNAYAGRESVDATLKTIHQAIRNADFKAFEGCFEPGALPPEVEARFASRCETVGDFGFRLDPPVRGPAAEDLFYRVGSSPALTAVLGLRPGTPVRLGLRRGEEGYQVADARIAEGGGPRRPGGAVMERDRRHLTAQVEEFFRKIGKNGSPLLTRLEKDGRVSKERAGEIRRRMESLGSAGKVRHEVESVEFPTPGRAQVTVSCRALAKALGLRQDRFVLEFGRSPRDRGWRFRRIRPLGS